ncbi:hypothetical protein, partial [Salinicola salarius]|uniref:hypothetical protein n=1 Tax=Salinicola salarius TaxID=430457 RepID=UPI004038AEED
PSSTRFDNNSSDKTAILNAVSWYDEKAQKVTDKRYPLSAAGVTGLTERYGCTEEQLSDFGYYRQEDGSYLTFESATDLRDAESVPLKDSIHPGLFMRPAR